MKNKIILFSSILMLTVLTNCNSQKLNMIDLSQGILGKHIDSIIAPNIKTMPNIVGHGLDNDGIETGAEEIMNFNGVSIYGYSDENKNYRKNSVEFLFKKKDKIITSYDIFTYQTEKSDLLIRQLDRFLGKPDFIGYRDVEARQAGDFNAKVWEDKTNNCTYLLDVSMQNYGKVCWLIVVDNSKSFFYNRAIGIAGFNRWRKYIKYKKRFEKPETFMYQDFIKDQTEKGDEYISILSE